MKRLLLFMLSCIIISFMLVGVVSAFEFDNVVDYRNSKTLDIKNSFGLGSTIATATLLTPNPNYVMRGLNRRVMIWEVENFDNEYRNAIDEVTIKNMLTARDENKNYHFEYAVYSERQNPKYQQSCQDVTHLNNSVQTICEDKIIGYEEERYIKEWIDLNDLTFPKGNITIALVTNVYENDVYDGIPTLMGVKLSSWAVWNESLDTNLIGYWKQDELIGLVSKDSINGSTNITWDAAPNSIIGLINNATNLTGTQQGNITHLTGITAQSISFWIKDKTFTNNAIIFNGVTPIGNRGGWSVYEHTNTIKINVYNTTVASINGGACDDTLNPDVWNHVVVTFDGVQTWKVYINGTAQTLTDSVGTLNASIEEPSFGYGNGAAYLTGDLDEIGYWQRELGAEEVTQLYNGGVGISYTGVPLSTTSTLVSPTNATSTLNTTITFDGTFTATSGNLTNVTLFLWNSTGDKINGGNVSLTGILNATNITYTLSTKDTYLWNFLACGTNSTDYSCSYATSNRTLTIGRFNENSHTFNTTAVEGSTQAFTINVTYNSTKYTIVTATLDYNGTDYLGTKVDSSPDTLFTRTLILPSSVNEVNRTFKWKFTMTSSEGTFYVNSTTRGQLNTIINMSRWGRPYLEPYINFTIYEEETLLPLNGTFYATLDYGVSNTNKEFSFQDTLGTNSTFSFAINQSNRNYLVSGLITYEAPGYTSKTYELMEQSFSNVTTLIPLYLLNTTDSTSFIVYVRDSSFTAVEGAYVYVQRYYPGTATWNSVEVLKTNYEGKSVGHFKTEDISYRFLVYVDGVLKLTSSSTKIFCEVTPCTITLTLPAAGGTAIISNLSELDYTLTYSKTDKEITYTYEDTSSEADGGFLIVKKYDSGNATTPTICNNAITTSSGIITCDISSYSNGTYIAYAYNNRTSDDRKLIDILPISKTRDIVSSVGFDGIIWVVFLMIGIIMIGLYSPPIAIVFGIATIILVSWIGLVSIPIISITAIIFIGGILLWLMRR